MQVHVSPLLLTSWHETALRCSNEQKGCDKALCESSSRVLPADCLDTIEQIWHVLRMVGTSRSWSRPAASAIWLSCRSSVISALQLRTAVMASSPLKLLLPACRVLRPGQCCTPSRLTRALPAASRVVKAGTSVRPAKLVSLLFCMYLRAARRPQVHPRMVANLCLCLAKLPCHILSALVLCCPEQRVHGNGLTRRLSRHVSTHASQALQAMGAEQVCSPFQPDTASGRRSQAQ